MRVWMWGVLSLVLCTALLSGLFSRAMVPHRVFWGSSSSSSSALSSSSSSASSSSSSSSSSSWSSNSNSFSSSSSLRTRGQLRVERAVHGFGSLLTEVNPVLMGTLRGEKGRRMKRERGDRRRCGLREVQVSVTQLGLGYESEETLVFRYCSGRCLRHRRTYDLALDSIQSAGLLKEPAPHVPCCRPLHYEEDFSFLGNNNQYYTIPELSAQDCGCV